VRRLGVDWGVRYALAVVVLLLSVVASAEPGVDFPLRSWHVGTHETDAGSMLPYRLLVPPAQPPGTNVPLVVLLHAHRGAGSADPEAGLYSFGVLSADGVRRRFPAYILTPRLPEARRWTVAGGLPGPELRAVAELANSLAHDSSADGYRIDPDRIYLVGEAEGADAVWALVTSRPGMFAAAVPIGGTVAPRSAPAASDLPVWVFHGELDERVPVARARAIVSAIWITGGESLRYTEHRGAGYGIWASVWEEPRLLPWLFSQRRE